MTTISATSSIVRQIFSTLVSDMLWTTTQVTAAVDLINDDPFLAQQLNDLNNQNWVVQYVANLDGNPSQTGEAALRRIFAALS
jgi:hypothetical protein